MKKISKLIVPALITGTSLISCINQNEFKAPNLGSVNTTLYSDGKMIQVHAVDDDLDRDIDRVFGDGYLMYYDAELPDSTIHKEGYDSLRTKPLSKTDERILSQKLEQNNLTEYLKSLEKGE